MATVCAALCMLAAPAASQAKTAAKPAITKFAVGGVAPTATAGIFEIEIAAKNAKSCTLTGPVAVIGSEWEGRCSKHARIHLVWIPENTEEATRTYHLTLVAHGTRHTAKRTITITIPGEPKFEPGIWIVTIEGSTKAELDFLTNGTLTVPVEPKDYGSWSYHHKVLKFDITATGATEILSFEATGPPGGPFAGRVTIGTESGAFTLEKAP